MNDDTRHFQQVIREYGPDDERKARVAGTLSIVAIFMLLVTNVTIANRGSLVAAPPAVPASSPAIPQPAVAAPYTPCPKLRSGAWLRSEIAHWRKDGWVITCSYWGQELMTRDEVRL